MPDVFISYSRRDSSFVSRLQGALTDHSKDVWVDTEGIADGEVFPQAIRQAIEQSDAFVFVITPDSIRSSYCENEVEHARRMQKRILPLLHQPVPDSDLPAEIRDRNWIPFTDEDAFEPGVERLLTALETDLDATRAHTRWLVKALEWEAADRDRSLLLRGAELKAAEAWLASRPEGADPAPTPLQREYVLASRSRATGLQRRLMAGSLAVAAVSLGLLIFALISRAQTASERVGARAQALAAESQAELPNDPEVSLILGLRAVRTRATAQTMFALRAALDASPLERALPTVASPGYCAANSGLSAAASPAAGQIALVDCNGLLRLLDPRTGRILRQQHFATNLTCVAYSPSGSLLAVGTSTGVILLNPSTGAVLVRSPALLPATGGGIDAIAFSPNGRLLAADDPNGVSLLTVPTLSPRTLVRSPNGLGGTIAFTSSGRLLVVGGTDAAVHIYDAATGRQVHVISAPVPTGRSWPEVVALSPDGSQLAVAYPTEDDEDGPTDVSLYDTRGWRFEYTIMSTNTGEVSSVSFSSDGTRLAVGLEDGTAGVWSLITRAQLVAFTGASSAVTSMSFLPGGRSLVTVANDGIGRIWRAIGTADATFAVPGSDDGFTFAGGRLAVMTVEGPISDRRQTLMSFALTSGQKLSTWQVGSENDLTAWLNPMSSYLATTGVWPGEFPEKAPIRIWDVVDHKLTRTLPPAAVSFALFSQDGSRLLLNVGESTADPSGRMLVADVRDGQSVELQPPSGTACSEQGSWSFSANDTRVAAAGFCSIVDIWSTANGRLLRQITQGGEASGVALSPDGRRLLVSSWDSRATMWSVATGRPLVQFIGHTSGITSTALSPDGSIVATAGLDDTVRLWNARTGQELRQLTFAAPQGGLVFSPSGDQLAFGPIKTVDGRPFTVTVYDTCPGCSDPRTLESLAVPGVIPPSLQTVLERTIIGRS